jgi:LigT like Phosphoesterase
MRGIFRRRRWSEVRNLSRPSVTHKADSDVRVFVAVWPDDSTLKRLSLLELGPVPGLRLVRPGRWHITVRFLGEVEEDLVPALVDALGDAAGSMAGPLRCEVGARQRRGSAANGCSRFPSLVLMKGLRRYVGRPCLLSRTPTTVTHHSPGT